MFPRVRCAGIFAFPGQTYVAEPIEGRDAPRDSRAERPCYSRAGRPCYSRAGRPRHGTILIVTMWVMLVLTGLTLVLGRSMRVEVVTSANEYSSLQAQTVEQGAIQYVLANLDGLKGKVPADGDIPCQGVRIGSGAFWILRSNDTTDDRSYVFGITDECSMVNLNSASLDMLSKLPDMTSELATCAIDWRSTGDVPSQGGAKDEYYLMLPDPYTCKKGPLESVEELMLVKGASKEILYGEDTNRNGVLDPNENDADVSEPSDNHDGKLDRGICPFATIYSVSPNLDSTGARRININTRQVVTVGRRPRRTVYLPSAALTTLLQQKLSAGRYQAVAATLATIFQGGSTRPFANVLDFYYKTGLTADEFKLVVDRLTTSTNASSNGRINMATAPKEVLYCLPGLEATDASALVAKRLSLSSTDLDNIAWVVQVLTPQKGAGIGGLITTRSTRFSADIVSVSSDGRAFRRCRIVVDNNASPPRVMYRQDLTRLGWPLAPAILTQLRQGVSIDVIAPAQTLRQEVTK